jgi:hypothetical protein
MQRAMFLEHQMFDPARFEMIADREACLAGADDAHRNMGDRVGH